MAVLSPADWKTAMMLLLMTASAVIPVCMSQASWGIPYDLTSCSIPQTLHGEWFSRERGENVLTVIDQTTLSTYGRCIEMSAKGYDNYTIVAQTGSCHHCVRILVRTLNVLEKQETGCVNLNYNERPSVGTVCRGLDPNQETVTMFSTNPSGKNCRSSMEGVWKFAYQNRYKFTGECTHPEANITACQKPGTQFFNVNQQFLMNYRKCDGVRDTEDAEVQYKCLGDWYIGKNHYFAVVNNRESRIEEKYRCFLANRDDDVYMSVSITAECNTLTSPQEGPERIHLFPVKTEVVPAKCSLPNNYTGVWVNTANFDSEVTINSTHMTEKWNPDSGRVKQEIFVCQERRGTRFVMARYGINGCQKDYVCFEFVPRHHNIIRYRKGQAMIAESFATVCAWTMFQDDEDWKYSIMIKKDPVAIKCPVAGKFRFTQTGELPFETRILGGVTAVPRPNVYCRENISDVSICDKDQKIMEIDADKCISVDYFGRPVDIYSDPDYRMSCIGFWKENLKSYLITYDQFDAYSKYRCWVYQRADLNKILMSMSVGAFCHIRQDVTSGLSREGAQVALAMTEYEREHDNCGMFFDDGADPWKSVVNSATVLTVNP